MNKKVFLIIYSPGLESELLVARIKALGLSYNFWGNHWFVQTSSTPKEVYEKIIGEEFVSTSILVVQMSDEMFSYYGRMNTALWDWMKKVEGR